MPLRLERFHGANHLHFITFSCYRRQQLLAMAHRRDAFLQLFEQVRRRYDFTVVGYVVMPEHVHLLISEPAEGDVALLMKVLKQRAARRFLARKNGNEQSLHFWQKRFYDFNVWSRRKEVEKLRYIHRNPVMRGLVTSPEMWRWSSFRSYAHGEDGLVKINAPLKRFSTPTQRKPR